MKQKNNYISILVLRGAVAKYLTTIPSITVVEDHVSVITNADRQEDYLSTEKVEKLRTRLQELQSVCKPHIVIPHPYLSADEISIYKQEFKDALILVVTSVPKVWEDQLSKGAHQAFRIDDGRERIEDFGVWLIQNHKQILQRECIFIDDSPLTWEYKDKEYIKSQQINKNESPTKKSFFGKLIKKIFG